MGPWLFFPALPSGPAAQQHRQVGQGGAAVLEELLPETEAGRLIVGKGLDPVHQQADELRLVPGSLPAAHHRHQVEDAVTAAQAVIPPPEVVRRRTKGHVHQEHLRHHQVLHEISPVPKGGLIALRRLLVGRQGNGELDVPLRILLLGHAQPAVRLLSRVISLAALPSASARLTVAVCLSPAAPVRAAMAVLEV